MKLIDDPNCTKCDQNTVGTYLHVFWECPSVYGLWSKVRRYLENVLGFPIPMHPPLLLFNDDSSLGGNIRLAQRKIIFAGLTAAKKTIIDSWFSPDTPSAKEWLNYFRDIALLERSLAVIHKARASTVQTWDALLTSLSDITPLTGI